MSSLTVRHSRVWRVARNATNGRRRDAAPLPGVERTAPNGRPPHGEVVGVATVVATRALLPSSAGEATLGTAAAAPRRAGTTPLEREHASSGHAIGAARPCMALHGMPHTRPGRPALSPMSPRTSSVLPRMRSRRNVLLRRKGNAKPQVDEGARLVAGEPPGRQDRLLVVDDLDDRRQLVGIDPDEHLAITCPAFRRRYRVHAGRALLLGAGQTLWSNTPAR